MFNGLLDLLESPSTEVVCLNALVNYAKQWRTAEELAMILLDNFSGSGR